MKKLSLAHSYLTKPLSVSSQSSDELIEEGQTDTDSLISENSPSLVAAIELVEKPCAKRAVTDEELGFVSEEEQSLITTSSEEDQGRGDEEEGSTDDDPSPPHLPLLPSLLPSFASNTSLLPSFPLDETWPPWSLEVFNKWPIFLSLALPAALSLFLEWGSYEVMAGFAGQLGSIPLATHGVFMNTASLAYNGPLSIAEATSVLTGNFLGKNQPSEAASMVLLGVMIDCVLGLLTGGILLGFLRSSWGQLFTTDLEVIEAVSDAMPVFFIYLVVDSIKCVTCNVLRSTGRPAVTTTGNLICCVFVLIPLGWYLAVSRGLGLVGLWSGMSMGWGVGALIYGVVLYRTDWERQAQEAFERNQASTKKPQLVLPFCAH
jgi:hypothetical protein